MGKKSNQAWSEFRTNTNRNFEKLFDRVTHLETNQAKEKERDKNLEEKMDTLLKTFIEHEKDEMKKYESTDNSIRFLTRFAFIATGMFLLLSFIGFDNVKKIMDSDEPKQKYQYDITPRQYPRPDTRQYSEQYSRHYPQNYDRGYGNEYYVPRYKPNNYKDDR